MLHEKTVGSYEAKTHLPQPSSGWSTGETIVITRHGKPVARLVPASTGKPRPDIRTAVAEMLASRDQRGPKLEGLSVRDLIEEGRR